MSPVLKSQVSWPQLLSVILAFLLAFGAAVASHASQGEKVRNLERRVNGLESKMDTVLVLTWKIAAKMGITDASANPNLGVVRSGLSAVASTDEAD